MLLVGDDLVTPDLETTTKEVFDGLVDVLYTADDHPSLSKVTSGGVELPLPADRFGSRLGNVDVSKKGLDTPYDRLVVVVVRLESGRHVAFFSDYPHDGGKAGVAGRHDLAEHDLGAPMIVSRRGGSSCSARRRPSWSSPCSSSCWWSGPAHDRPVSAPAPTPAAAASSAGLAVRDEREVTFEELTVTLPGTPFSCHRTAPDAPARVRRLRSCFATVHEDYDGEGGRLGGPGRRGRCSTTRRLAPTSTEQRPTRSDPRTARSTRRTTPRCFPTRR